MSNAAIAKTHRKKGRFDWCCRREISASGFKQIRPILRIMKFIGVFPCNTTSNGVKMSGIFEYAWAAMWLTFHATTLVIIPPAVVMSVWKFLGPVSLIKEYSYNAAVALDTFNFLCRHRTVNSFFGKLEKFDEDARHLGHPRQGKVAVYWMVTVVGIGITSSLTALGLAICITAHDECTWVMTELLHELHQVHLTLKWVILLHAMNQRFRHFNDIVGSDLLVRPAAYNSSHAKVTRDVIAFRQNLVEVVDIFNSLASYVVLISFSALFLTILLHVKSLSGNETPLIIKLLGVVAFAQIAVVCYVCDTTASEANAAGRHITDCPTILKYSSAIEERMSVEMHLMHKKIAFTGGDFFTINLAAFFEILLAFFSFTVILWGFE